MADEIAQTTGAVLAGRWWHDVAMAKHDGRAGIYGGRYKGRVLVITHTPPTDPPDPEIVFASGSIEDAVAAGLLDEIVAHVVPVPPRGRRPALRQRCRRPDRQA